MRVVGEQRLAGCGVIATDDPVVAAQAVANFLIAYREHTRRTELARADVRSGTFSALVSLVACARHCGLEHAVRLHVIVIIIFVVGIEVRALRAVVDRRSGRRRRK